MEHGAYLEHKTNRNTPRKTRKNQPLTTNSLSSIEPLPINDANVQRIFYSQHGIKVHHPQEKGCMNSLQEASQLRMSHEMVIAQELNPQHRARYQLDPQWITAAGTKIYIPLRYGDPIETKTKSQVLSRIQNKDDQHGTDCETLNETTCDGVD